MATNRNLKFNNLNVVAIGGGTGLSVLLRGLKEHTHHITAIIGVIYARYEGFNTLKSGMAQLVKNEVPIYEIVSGATLTFAAILLIIPGFATDCLGLLLIIPITRKLIFNAFSKKFNKKNNTYEKKDFIEGEYKDMDEK